MDMGIARCILQGALESRHAQVFLDVDREAFSQPRNSSRSPSDRGLPR